MKISLPGLFFSYLLAIIFIVFWKSYLSGKNINQIIEYIILVLNSCPRKLIVIIALVIFKSLNFNTENLILGGFVWFFSYLVYNIMLLLQSMDKTLKENYIITAHAKGLSKFVIITRHALINALIPLLTNIRPLLAMALFGSQYIERTFNIKGMGYITIDALKNNDHILYTDLVFFGVCFFVVSNFISDLIIYYISPYKEKVR